MLNYPLEALWSNRWPLSVFFVTPSLGRLRAVLSLIGYNLNLLILSVTTFFSRSYKSFFLNSFELSQSEIFCENVVSKSKLPDNQIISLRIFNSQAVGMDSRVQSSLKSILRGNPIFESAARFFIIILKFI